MITIDMYITGVHADNFSFQCQKCFRRLLNQRLPGNVLKAVASVQCRVFCGQMGMI